MQRSVPIAIGSKDGPKLEDGTARVWNLSGPHPVATDLPGHFAWPTTAAFSPDGGRVVIAHQDGTVRLWDLSGSHPVATVIDRRIWRERNYAVRTIAFNPDGRPRRHWIGRRHSTSVADVSEHRRTLRTGSEPSQPLSVQFATCLFRIKWGEHNRAS